MTATPHDHRTHVPGCFRCELSADEVTATPARDALACYWHVLGTYIDAEHLDRIVRSHGHVAVLAALVESGWRPTADQLRAMGGDVLDWETASHQFAGTVLVRFPEGVAGD